MILSEDEHYLKNINWSDIDEHSKDEWIRNIFNKITALEKKIDNIFDFSKFKDVAEMIKFHTDERLKKIEGRFSERERTGGI